MGKPKLNLSRIRAMPVNGAWDWDQCTYCPWFELAEHGEGCKNRSEFVCWLHLSEVFGLHDA